MGNTSDRVSGAKTHKDLEPSKMMDSTDDPNIFNTHGPEYKVCMHVFSENPHHNLFVKVKRVKSALLGQAAAENTPETVLQARPTVIRWTGGGKDVYITGSFNSWSSKIPMNKRYLCAHLSINTTMHIPI